MCKPVQSPALDQSAVMNTASARPADAACAVLVSEMRPWFRSVVIGDSLSVEILSSAGYLTEEASVISSL